MTTGDTNPRTYRTKRDVARSARAVAGFAQAVLADECGIAVRTVRNIESGVGASATSIKAFAAACRIADWRDLVVDEERPLLAGPHAPAGPVPSPLGGATPPTPDIRAHVCRLPAPITPYLYGREAEVERLDAAWREGRTAVFCVEAGGGGGKSALVSHWLARLAADGYRGAEAVFAWSFQSQGAADLPRSADLFIDHALRWFGDPDAAVSRSPRDRGARLAELVRGRRALLILDGLEALQWPPGSSGGLLRDDALRAFLRDLSARNSGLCVVTTRTRVADLHEYFDRTAQRVPLPPLSLAAGVRLLQQLGVEGTRPRLEAAAGQFDCHPLALTLLGTYLRKAYRGDVRRARDVSLLTADDAQGGRAAAVMESYARWFGGGPEVSVLGTLSLFDGPADARSLAALRAAAIPGLTEGLACDGALAWELAVANLRDAHLIAVPPPDDPGSVDTHALVRAFFGGRLRRDAPEAWRLGHDCLYAHFQREAPPRPDTLEQMAPLYRAVGHGCRAGRHRDAWDEVYVPRIQRGEEAYNARVLGAIDAELALLGGFFERPWDRPVGAMTGAGRGLLLHDVGYNLRAVGRLTEAVGPMRDSVAAAAQDGDWVKAALRASNLSGLYLSLGAVADAVVTAEEAVRMADRSGNPYARMGKRARLADALHQRGDREAAGRLFEEGEAIQRASEPGRPTLDSFWGYWYCDLLLDRGEWRAVGRRAGVALRHAEAGRILFDIGLARLALGRAAVVRHQLTGAGLRRAGEHLTAAVEHVRRATMLDYLPRALLARAEWHRLAGNAPLARQDLEEATAVSADGRMERFRADCELGWAAFHLENRDADQAGERLRAARTLVERIGYARRNGELVALRDRLRHGGGLGAE